jgi:hypothetical protein
VINFDPWKSGENNMIVSITLDMTRPENNSKLAQALDATENIRVLHLNHSNLLTELEQVIETEGWLVRAQLWSYAYGLSRRP